MSSGNYVRTIEIPVQHVKPSSNSSGTSTNQNSSSLLRDRESSPIFNLHQKSLFDNDLNNGFPSRSSLFDKFDSFDSPLRSRLDNRDRDHRFPLLSRFGTINDSDDFFSPQKQTSFNHPNVMQQTIPSYFQRGNTAREDSPTTTSNGTQTTPRSLSQTRLQQPSAAQKILEKQMNNSRENSRSRDVNSPSRQEQKSESPKRFVSQAYIQPQPPQTASTTNGNPTGGNSISGSKGIPIRIHHIATSPSDFTDNDSTSTDLQTQQKKQKETTPPNPSPVASNLAQPIPLHAPSASQPAPTQQHHQPSSQLNEHQKTTAKQSDFISPQPPSTQTSQQANAKPVVNQQLAKSTQEKCDDVSVELNRLEQEVLKFTAFKSDKLYLKLEELLTRCLLKLDEIDHGGDEKMIQLRKRLINFANELSDKLEVIATSNEKQHQEAQNNENKEKSPSKDPNNRNDDDEKNKRSESPKEVKNQTNETSSNDVNK